MVVVGWTSILHDIAQWNNSEEAMEAHPKLAADWARAHLPGIIDSDRLAKIVQTIELHSLTPEHNSQPMSNELRLFRSLDAAALVRLGMDTTQFHLPISLLEEGELAPPGLSLPCMAQRLETTYRKLEESTRQFEVGYNLEPNRFIQMVNAGVLCNIVLPL